MDTHALISKSFDQLLREAREILSQCGWDGHEFHGRYPADNDYTRFRTAAMNLIRRSCGQDSDHYRELKRFADTKEISTNSYFFVHCLGVVEAAKRDFDSGLLFDMRRLISAEILGDFIEQAEVLLANGYHVPVASLAGAVLEDTLRKLCDKNSISIPKSTRIDSLNAELARAGIYDKLVQKRVTALADIRNNADHGHFNKFKIEDVEDMVKWIRTFAADYLK